MTWRLLTILVSLLISASFVAIGVAAKKKVNDPCTQKCEDTKVTCIKDAKNHKEKKDCEKKMEDRKGECKKSAEKPAEKPAPKK